MFRFAAIVVITVAVSADWALAQPEDAACTLTLDGRPLATLSVRERARALAYVPQVHAGTFAFSVSEVVLMGRTARSSLFAAPSAHDREMVEAMLQRLGLAGKTLLVDVKPEDKLVLSVRNIEGVRVLPSNRISARDVMNTKRVVLTKAAIEKLQEALG